MAKRRYRKNLSTEEKLEVLRLSKEYDELQHKKYQFMEQIKELKAALNIIETEQDKIWKEIDRLNS